MVIKISKTVNNWVDIISYLLENFDQAIKGHGGYYFRDIDILNFKFDEDPFKTCLYRNPRGKLTTLRKQYLNSESLKQIFSNQVVKVSMVGGPKWGTTKGNKHCMESLLVDHTNKVVQINFRNSDFFKKFLVDIYFVEEILREVGISGYRYCCHFDQLTLRTPFTYLYLEQVLLNNTDGELKVRDYLSSDNSLMFSFIHYYRDLSNKKLSWKSLERAFRVMKESTAVYRIIKEYL